jgi:hypothetical protein
MRKEPGVNKGVFMSEQSVKVKYEIDDEIGLGEWIIEEQGEVGPTGTASLDMANGVIIGFDFANPDRPVWARVPDTEVERQKFDDEEHFIGPDQIILASLFGPKAIAPMDHEPEDEMEVKVPLEKVNLNVRRILGGLAVISQMRFDRRHTLVIPDRERMLKELGPDSSLLKFKEEKKRIKEEYYRDHPMPDEEILTRQEDDLMVKLAKELWMIDFNGWFNHLREERSRDNE